MFKIMKEVKYQSKKDLKNKKHLVSKRKYKNKHYNLQNSAMEKKKCNMLT